MNATPILPSVNGDITLEGPNNLWIKTYNYSYDPEPVRISRTDEGYIIGGTCSGNASDGLVVHVDAEGDVLFRKQLGGERLDNIESAIQCQNGDFVIAGWSDSYSPEPSSAGFTWLVRLANNGSVLWENWYNDTDWANSVVECPDGSFIIAGLRPHLMHVDSNGSVIWKKSYEDWDISEAASVVVCDDGGFAFTGLADTDPTGEIDYQAWLVRTDPNGTMLWNQTYGDAALTAGRSLIRCSDGGFAIVGEAGAWFYFPRFPWLVRTDENGTLLWQRTYSTGYGYSVIECPDGGFGIAGVYAESGSYASWDALFIRADEEGIELWRSICSGSNEDRAFSLVLDNDGGFAVAGWTAQTHLEAFLWKLSDDYVTPTTPPSDNIILPPGILEILILGSGVLVVALVVWKSRD